MIISKQKSPEEILCSLEGYGRVFLVGCGECATACQSGGEAQVAQLSKLLAQAGKTITGTCVPSAPCIAAKLKAEMAKYLNAVRQAEAVLVLACGLGVQSFKDNDRFGLVVLPACDSLFGAVMDAQGNFFEKCSMCSECVLALTAGICPVTLCPKGLQNGPCGGVNQGKCEVDSQKDCAWVLIYQALEKQNKLEQLKVIRQPKDFKKSTKPHKLILK
jgi:ferredoxin